MLMHFAFCHKGLLLLSTHTVAPVIDPQHFDTDYAAD